MVDPFPQIPPYYYQGPIANFLNSIFHSKPYMKLNILRKKNEYDPEDMQMLPQLGGLTPIISFKYGSLDYTRFKKHMLPFKDEADWNPVNDKATPPGSITHGHLNEREDHPLIGYPIYFQFPILRGCAKEIDKFTKCAKSGESTDNCYSQRINVLEVCPHFELQKLKEFRKFMLRAEAIDNMTYRRAMEVSEYNKGRTVSDIKYHNADMLKPDTYYSDDRYQASKITHPHRDDVYNFPEHEYNDMYNGTVGNAEAKLKEKYQKSVLTHMSEKDKERIAPSTMDDS
jgi:hypothetical protein